MASAAATAAVQSLAEVTSSRTKRAAWPSSAATTSPWSTRMSANTTLAPSETNRRASASPWPCRPGDDRRLPRQPVSHRRNLTGEVAARPADRRSDRVLYLQHDNRAVLQSGPPRSDR